MTRRLALIAVLGVVAVVATGGFALSAGRPAPAVKTDPTWGLFTKAQWRSLGASRVVTAMPPLAIVERRGCLVVLHGTASVATVCRTTQPVRLFRLRAHGMTDVVGIVAPGVAGVVGGGYNLPLLRAPHGHVFGVGLRSPGTFTAYDTRGRVVARIYCASALRGVCGMSAHRRS